MSGMSWLGYDTETYLIAPGRIAPTMVCVSTYDGRGMDLLLRKDAKPITTKALTDPDWGIVGANTAFDMGVAAATWPDLIPAIWRAYNEERIRCVQIAERMLKIRDGNDKFCPIQGKPPRYSLGDLVKQYLGIEMVGKKGEDIWRLRYRELDNVPIDSWPKEASSYAMLDARYAWEVWAMQEGQEMPTLNLHTVTSFAMLLMRAWGLRADPVKVAELKRKLEIEIADATPKLIDMGLVRATGSRNMAAIRERIENAYQAQNETAPRTASSDKYPEGQISTSGDTLRGVTDEGLSLLEETSYTRTLYNGFLPRLEEATVHPFCPRWNALVATARTSCGSKEDPGNLQNQPRKGGVRECWIARDGHVYVAADYETAELRSLAEVLLELFGESALADVLIEGKDPHKMTAASLLDWTYEDVVAVAMDENHADYSLVMDRRQLSKIVNFGAPGMLSAPVFRQYAAGYGVVLTEDEAFETIAAWRLTYPEIPGPYFNHIKKQCIYGGGTASITHPLTGFMRGDCRATSAANHYFQHLTAMGAKAALNKVVQQCYDLTLNSPLFGARTIAFIHDEVIIEVREEYAHEASLQLVKVMKDEMQKVTPRIPVGVEVSMMRRWYKGAKPVYSKASGRLIPWEPKVKI
jgi:DNA polymerase-1